MVSTSALLLLYLLLLPQPPLLQIEVYILPDALFSFADYQLYKKLPENFVTKRLSSLHLLQ